MNICLMAPPYPNHCDNCLLFICREPVRNVVCALNQTLIQTVDERVSRCKPLVAEPFREKEEEEQ